MITFQLETWARYYADASREALWQEHYDFLHEAHAGELPMAPNVMEYEMMDKLGMLAVMVAREAGVMVGYSLFIVKRHLHYSAPVAFEDSYFLTERLHRTGAGRLLMVATLASMWARGAVRAYIGTKEFASIAAMLEGLGGKKMDQIFMFKNPRS